MRNYYGCIVTSIQVRPFLLICVCHGNGRRYGEQYVANAKKRRSKWIRCCPKSAIIQRIARVREVDRCTKSGQKRRATNAYANTNDDFQSNETKTEKKTQKQKCKTSRKTQKGVRITENMHQMPVEEGKKVRNASAVHCLVHIVNDVGLIYTHTHTQANTYRNLTIAMQRAEH